MRHGGGTSSSRAAGEEGRTERTEEEVIRHESDDDQCTGFEFLNADGPGTFSCATVTVPMDYDRPDGKTIQIAMKKRAADGQSHGSLFINPGGPGGSGIERTAQGRSRWACHQCTDTPPL